MILAGWGNFPRAECRVLDARGEAELAAKVAAEPSLIARGNGRAYGDAALNPLATLGMRRHDRMIAFDPATGQLTCESGVLLSDVIETFLPRGWFPAVTPGTRLVTIGGMIAADVHGKNHHMAGSFCRHVESLELMGADGGVVTCSRSHNADLFRATCGGMGLTGVIVRASFRLIRVPSAWIRQETVKCAGLDEVMAGFEESTGWTYSVAWIDCLAKGGALGRSLLYRGEHALPGELAGEFRQRPFDSQAGLGGRVPVTFPDFALNPLVVRAFNELYFRRGRPGTAILPWRPFFYPLDGLRDWNRIYGRRGFAQYQCVLPKAAAQDGLSRLLDRISATGFASFLAVLKLFGPGDEGFLSFPMEGYTLALDFPMRPGTLDLLRSLDAIVADHGGRLYLAKDSRADAAMMARGYPDLPRFAAIRQGGGRFNSLLSQRLDL